MQNVPKVVQARLQQPTHSKAEPHPDADLLTAFAEHSLAARERDHVLEHLARCGDCREVVALALPATEAAALAGSRSTARIGWLSLPVLRWGVVTAGVLAITSVGIMQYRQRHEEKTLVASSLTPRDQLDKTAAQNPPSSSHATTSQPVAPQRELGKQTEMAKKEPSRAQSASSENKPTSSAHEMPVRPQPRLRVPSVGWFGGTAGGTAIGSGSFRSNSKNVTSAVIAQQNSFPHAARRTPLPSVATDAGGLGGPVTTEASAQSQTHDQLAQNEQEETSQSLADHVGKAKPASVQASPAMAPAPMLRTEPTLMKGLVEPRWTISASGALQRSLDGGKTWLDVEVAAPDSANANLMRRASTAMKSQVTVDSTNAAPETTTETQAETTSEAKTAAKSAPRPGAPALMKSAQAEPAARTIFRAVSVSSNAAEVWAGGSDGALYHTLDGGNRWARVVPSNAGSILTGDVISIQFSDVRNGVVTTSTSEVWTTLDAGQTWHRQP